MILAPSRIKLLRNRAPSASTKGQAAEVEADSVRGNLGPAAG